MAWRGLCQALAPGLLVGLFLGSCTAPGGKDVVTPDVRTAVPVWQEHEIQAGRSNSYPVELKAGQFVRAVVDQVSADVEVLLQDPAGKTVTMDSMDRTIWDEELAAVAERSGLHQILVRWPAPAESGTGRYRLRIDQPRLAAENDSLRVKALRLGYEAAVLAATSRNEESRRRQLELRQESLSLWQKVGDPQREAEALYHVGLLQRDLDQPGESAESFHRALAGLSDAAQRAQVLNEAGRACWDDHPQEAREHFEEALPLARRSDDRRLLFDVLSNLGRFHTNELGEPRTAIEVYLEEALGVARSVDRLTQAKAHINLGSAYADLSEYQKALEHSDRGLQLARELEHREQITALNNLGDIYYALGEPEKASQYFRQALEHDLGDPLKRAKTLQNLGVALEKSGQIEDALRELDKALDLARSIQDRDLQAYILTNRGYLHLGKHEYPQALAACQQARDLATRPETRARTLHILGASHRNLGDLPAAREALNQALELSQEDLDLEADITMVLAKVEKDAGDLEKAGELAGQAIDTIEQLRDRVVRQDLRETFLASKQGFYEFYVDVLMELERRDPGRGFAGRALDMNERARARGLLDLLVEVGADLSRDADANLLAKERGLRAEISALYQHRLKLVKEGVTGERLEEAGTRLNEAIERLYRTTAELKASSPHFAALARPEPLTSARIQERVLDLDSVLLEYALGEERSWLWVVTSNAIHTFALPPKSEIEKAATELYEEISHQPPAEELGKAEKAAWDKGKKVAGMILEKAEPLLGNRRLLVVSDGALHYVPFTTLPSSRGTGRSLLLDYNEVVYLPSASTLAVLREEEAKRQRPAKTIAAFGDPVFNERDARLRQLRNSLPPQSRAGNSQHRGLSERADTLDLSRLSRLTFTQDEVNAIVGFAEPERSFKALGFAANLAEVTSERLAEYRIVHFATHGIIYTDTPELSGLVFSTFDERAQPVDGFLRLTDVYALQLNADLVTLSACETALGRELRGEGLIGLTRGFMYAGSSRVLATLWKVDDRFTMKLMKSFYEAHLRQGRSAPAALREAQSVIRRDPQRRHPYYWAGFSLQGESR